MIITYIYVYIFCYTLFSGKNATNPDILIISLRIQSYLKIGV